MTKNKVLVLDFKNNLVDFGETSKISERYFKNCKTLELTFRSFKKDTIYNRPLNKKFLRVIL